MVGKNIKELREEKGYTQKELASKIGVSQGAVYFWEKEINEPTAGYIVKMASIFGVSVDDLLSYENVTAYKNEKGAKLMSIFGRLNDEKKDVLIAVAEEFLKQACGLEKLGHKIQELNEKYIKKQGKIQLI